MSKIVTTDPNTLASVVTGLGGTVIPGPTFRFDLPLEKVREVVLRLNDLGLACRKISERVEDHPTRLFTPMSVATLELYKPAEQKEELREAWFAGRR